jgi:predicted DNA-binding transcriptional regulator YafY
VNDLVKRLFALVDLLQSHGQTTTPELARALAVSERTVQRDLVRLQALDIAVESAPGRTGGVSLEPGSLLSPLRFTEDELLALGLGIKLVARLRDATLERAASGASKRLEQVLTARTAAQLEALSKALAFEPAKGLRRSSVRSLALLELSEATHKGLTLELRYASPKRAESRRAVDPYGLAQLYGNWYLVGYCHLRLELRTFRVDRIRSFEPLGTFSRPEGFDTYGETVRSLNRAPLENVELCKVRLSATMDEASERLPSFEALLEPGIDGVLLSSAVPVEYLDSFALKLLDVPGSLEILETPALRKAFVAVGERALLFAQG